METKLEEDKSVPLYLGVSGLGGWLILFQITFYASVLSTIIGIFVNYLPMFSAETWNRVTSTSSEIYHPLIKPLLIFELSYNVLNFIFMIIILCLFYAKKRILPTLVILILWISLLFMIIDIAIVEFIPTLSDGITVTEMITVGRLILTSTLWTLYFKRSERVQNTFVR